MSTGEVRRTVVEARSTDTFGRVLLNTRDQHFVIDGPGHNGCPGEAVTPPEAFLAGVAACGVELLHVIARDENLPASAPAEVLPIGTCPVWQAARSSM